jgi:N-methylhydantoinase B
VNQYVVNRIHTHPGIAGGHNGAPDRVVLAAGTDHAVEVAPTVAMYLLETGEQLVYDFGGGGGWGDPYARDPAAVLDDVWDEYVSIEAAERDYGVVITGSLEAMDLAIDHDATLALRARA